MNTKYPAGLISVKYELLSGDVLLPHDNIIVDSSISFSIQSNEAEEIATIFDAVVYAGLDIVRTIVPDNVYTTLSNSSIKIISTTWIIKPADPYIDTMPFAVSA